MVHPPRYSSCFQLVGDAHIPGPDIELPFLQAQHPTEDGAGMDTNPHVQVNVQLLLDESGIKAIKEFYEISVLKSSPLLTGCLNFNWDSFLWSD